MAVRELGAARPSGFHGEEVRRPGLDFAWMVRDHVNVSRLADFRW